MSDTQAFAPGAVLGILGGGQLARMIALAAADYGVRCHIYAPEADSPAFDVAAAHTIGTYEDADALERFAEAVDLVTYEFENVPAQTASVLAAHRPLRPGAKALSVTQDRLIEKSFVADLGLPVAPFRDVDGLQALEAAVAANPDDLQARYDLANARMAAGDRDGAAEGFLSIVAAERDWNEGAARQQLLKLFEVVGLEDPWVSAQRRKLSAILFG